MATCFDRNGHLQAISHYKNVIYTLLKKYFINIQHGYMFRRKWPSSGNFALQKCHFHVIKEVLY